MLGVASLTSYLICFDSSFWILTKGLLLTFFAFLGCTWRPLSVLVIYILPRPLAPSFSFSTKNAQKSIVHLDGHPVLHGDELLRLVVEESQVVEQAKSVFGNGQNDHCHQSPSSTSSESLDPDLFVLQML